jgi:hypothetical protein
MKYLEKFINNCEVNKCEFGMYLLEIDKKSFPFSKWKINQKVLSKILKK